MPVSSWTVAIDVGGTFTDLVAYDATGRTVHLKVPSTPADPSAGFLDALEHLRERTDISSADIELVLHGTTHITNAIIEGRFARTALVTTMGFRDVLEIGRHWRSHLYDLTVDKHPTLVPRPLRLEARERMDADGTALLALSDEEVETVAASLEGEEGIEAIAVCLLHAYANPSHERQLARRLRGVAPHVSASHELSREPREFERTATTALNAALMPLAHTYLSQIEEALEQTQIYVTHSNGGAMTVEAARRHPVRLAQSGPVAGVTATRRLGEELERGDLIAFDVGGTSTDVALIEDGKPRMVNELTVGELPVRLRSVQIKSVGAGGGSIAWVDEQEVLRVGPQSSGAQPGPACYGRGGTLPTVTDCHLLLGRIPTASRLGGFLALDMELATTALVEHVCKPLGLGVEAAAQAVLDIATAEMEGAIRVLMRERGSDPRDFSLVAFGGAGPLHAVELAARLGIDEVVLPAHPGTFSAFGLASSDVTHAFSAACRIPSADADAAGLLAVAYADLEEEALAWFRAHATQNAEPQLERHCDARYVGQAFDITVPLGTAPSGPDALARLVDDFHAAHERAFAFSNPEEPCEIRAVWVSLSVPTGHSHSGEARPREGVRSAADGTAEVVIDGELVDCPVLARDSLGAGEEVPCPVVLTQDDTTIFIPPEVRVRNHPSGALLISGIAPA